MDNKDTFNLSEERTKLVQVLRNELGIHNSVAWRIVKRVVEQDKTFIQKVKEAILINQDKYCGEVCGPEVIEEIDTLAGEELLK